MSKTMHKKQFSEIRRLFRSLNASQRAQALLRLQSTDS